MGIKKVWLADEVYGENVKLLVSRRKNLLAFFRLNAMVLYMVTCILRK